MANRMQFAYSELKDAQGLSVSRPLLKLQLAYQGKNIEAKTKKDESLSNLC